MVLFSCIYLFFGCNRRKQCVELRAANEQDLLRMDLLKHELDTLIRQVNELKIESVLYENNRVKLNRAVSRLEYIQRLDASISRELMNAELLWVLMQLDLEKIRDRFDNADEMNGESKRCFRRIDTMRQIERNGALEEAYGDYLAQLYALSAAQDSSTEQRPGEESIRGMKVSLQHFSGLLKRLSQQCDSIAKGKYHRKADEMLKQLYVKGGGFKGCRYRSELKQCCKKDMSISRCSAMKRMIISEGSLMFIADTQ